MSVIMILQFEVSHEFKVTPVMSSFPLCGIIAV